MKRHRLSLFLISLLIITSVIGLLSVKGLAQTDLNYTFQNDNLYQSDDPLFNQTFNIKDSEYSNGTYPATYSFTDDVSGSEPDDWIITLTDGSVEVIASLDGHEKVVNLSRVPASNVEMRQLFVAGDQIAGTVEWFWRTTDVTKNSLFYYFHDSDAPISILISDSKFKYYDGAVLTDSGISVIADKWYHSRVDFDCNTDLFDFYINGLVAVAGASFRFVADHLEGLFFLISNGATYESYLDAIGYSWDHNYYNFDDDIIGSEPEGWESYNVLDCTSNIIASLGGKTNVLDLYDASGATRARIKKNLTQEIDQTIQFSMAKNDTTSDTTGIILFYEDDDLIFTLSANEDDFFGGISSKTNFIIVDTFFDVRVMLNDGSNTFDVFINDVLEFNDESYDNPTTISINQIHFWTGVPADENYCIYIDDVWISSESFYKIGDNLFPEIYLNETYSEVERWDFSFQGLNTLYEIGDDDPAGWIDIEVGGDVTNINTDPSNTGNMLVDLLSDGDVEVTTGLEKEFDITEGILNFTWEFNVSDRSNNLCNFNVSLDYADNSLIADIGIYFEGGGGVGGYLYYFDGVEYTKLADGVVNPIKVDERYTFNLYLDSWIILTYYENDVLVDSFSFDKLRGDQKGLSKVNFTVYTEADPPNDFLIKLDSVSIYSNSISLSDDLGYMLIELASGIGDYWDFPEHNLLRINASTNMYIGAGVYNDWDAGVSVFESIRTLFQYYYGITTINLINKEYEIEWGQGVILDPMLIFFITGRFNISTISIDGVKLTEGSNEYPLLFTSNGVDVNESYFYVDSSNRLRGQCFYNDSDLEFIQANFDINNVLNENRSLIFRSQFSGQFGFFSLGYIDATSTSISLPIRERGHNILIPQAKTIGDFVFLITDDDNLEAGYGSGLISDIELIWNPSISISIITISLIMIIIPIIIIIVPTLLLYSRFGKSVIMPVFIFMSVICFVGGLIPAWLFFILMVGAGGFLVLKKGSDE